MRICQVVTYDVASPCGGVKHHAVHLAAALREVGDEVDIIGPASARVESGIRGFSGVVNIPANGSDNFIGLFVSPREVRRYLIERDFDVIHVHEPLVPALSHLAVWQTPRAAHVATFHAYSERETLPERWLRRAGAAVALRGFARGIAVSEPAARLAAGAWRGPLTVIPNGVPTDIFSPPPVERVPVGPLRLLFVGRLGDRRKGVRFLLDAYARLLHAGVPVTLDIIGELGGAKTPPALPGLSYHGPLPLRDLVRHYRDCDLFVAPATGQESFGIVILEAMACGRAVLCSDIEGFRQIARGDGACLVPPGDPASLADAIARLAADRGALRRMGLRNRDHALDYDWSGIARRVRDEYVRALGTGDAPWDQELGAGNRVSRRRSAMGGGR